MPLSKQAQDAILKADAERRAARYLLESATLGIDMIDNAMSDRYKVAHAPKDSHVNPCLVRSIGVVCPPPKTRASQDNWARGMKGTTKGVAPGSTEPTPSVRIIHNGVETIVPANNFGKSSKSRGAVQRRHRATPETANLKIVGGHDFT